MIGNSNTIQIEIQLDSSGTVTGFRKVGDESEKMGGRIRKAGHDAADFEDKTTRAYRNSARDVGFFNRNIMQTAAGFAIGNMAVQAFHNTLRLVRNEIMLGLGAAEDMNIKIASMTAFITTFSQRSKDGDIAGGFREANEYAKALIPRLEILDAKTVATGRDLQTMAETMAMNGVVLDINNKKQEQGFINIANALKLVTAGQNQDIQLRQEINALLLGQVRMTDRLPKLLSIIDKNLEKHLEQWKQEGTLIENVGDLLSGFSATTDLISATWAAIGTTQETIHTRILRGGMLPAYADLLGLVVSINRSLMDQDGNLTPIAQKVMGMIAVGWLDIKNLVESISNIILTFEGPLMLIGNMVSVIADGWGMILAMLPPILNIVKLIGQAMWKNVEMIWKGLTFDFEGAKSAFEEGGRLMGEAMATDLRTEFERRLGDYFDAKDIGITGPALIPPVPVLAHGMSESQLKEIEKATKIREKLGRDLLDEIKNQTLEEYEYKKWALDREVADMYAKAGQDKEIEDMIAQYRRNKIIEIEKAQRDALTDRLNDWSRFYDELQSKAADHAETERKHINELNQLYEQQRDIRKSTDDMLLAITGDNRTPLMRYLDEQTQMADQYRQAMEKVGEERISALEEYKQRAADMAGEYRNGVGGIPGFVVGMEAEENIRRAYKAQQQAMATLEEEKKAQIATDKIWGETLQQTISEAAATIADLEQQITALDQRIAAMNPTLKIAVDLSEVDAAEKRLRAFRASLSMSLSAAAPGLTIPVLDSYARGTDYVPKTGIYKLHEGEAVVPAAENIRGMGGSSVSIQGGVQIVLPESVAASKPEDWDWRRIVREQVMPAIKEAGNA